MTVNWILHALRIENSYNFQKLVQLLTDYEVEFNPAINSPTQVNKTTEYLIVQRRHKIVIYSIFKETVFKFCLSVFLDVCQLLDLNGYLNNVFNKTL